MPVISKSEARSLSRREAADRRREAEAVRTFHLYLDQVWEGWQRFEGGPMYRVLWQAFAAGRSKQRRET